MKANAITSVLIGVLVVTGAVTTLTTLQTASAQQTGDEETREKPAMMRERCQAMLKQHQAMHSKRQAMDDELDELVAQMKEAQGDEKIDAISTVVEKLVEQRRAMHAMMPQMRMQTMRHMMEHMRAGKESMTDCPFMKGMGMKQPQRRHGHSRPGQR